VLWLFSSDRLNAANRWQHIAFCSLRCQAKRLSLGKADGRCESCVVTVMAELLLDSDIRFWVFLPIVVITFLVGVVRHYVSILLSSQKKVELQQVQDR
jgi:hypothetical protein